ncbi:type IIL restriction-modification enzyme MmeI [Pseudonocardia sp. 73-21]|uniref:Eco57I restriction-modification methylase domain-containing protein n=1 Tax=Pseudonocardia sp. 73-21 TaxID=1895809 RepID=UPI000969716F|nr:type IIL restriction-modification enzyme MmeI [Pseudonocardia sp. 73-21]OJY47496.1 MAG: hypothetical protein BGP03_32645 [Pseudonocardia sp. 73-21]
MAGRRRRRYSAGEAARRRHAWLELVQTSGPFLTLPVVERVFPNGLPDVPGPVRADVREATTNALSSGGASRHAAVRTVLHRALDWAGHLRLDTELPAALAEPVAEHGLLLRPDLGFYAERHDDPTELDDETDPDDEDPDSEDGDSEDGADPGDTGDGTGGPWRLLGMVTDWGAHPLARTTRQGWTASPVERLAVLLRARDVPVGLVTDGRWWALVWAPLGGTTGAAVFDASLWGEEPESFAAFVALLTRARFLAVAPTDTLPALFVESLGAQEVVTVTLGRQVRDAVELLIGTLDRLDAESGILGGVSDDELYDGVVTFMMRLVFLLFAEERRLLPSDDDVYVAAYSVGRLGDQLAVTEPQILERRTGAWHRLLAVGRAVHGGVAHEDLRLPAYGGNLFDPDRFPWLEGRRAGEATTVRPPAVDDRTVLRLLRAVQEVVIDGERRRLTFRTLDVEQIGYVYEGLLELEVRTATVTTLSLARPSAWPKVKQPAEITIDELSERLGAPEGPSMAEWVAARSSWSVAALERMFESPLQAERRAALLRATGDPALTERIAPYAVALRWDELGRPAVTLPGRRFVAPSTRRASTGTHYTPRALAEDVAGNTLEPLVYRPGPLETADRSAWVIRPSSELLDLRVADIAMGSGAFLVAACRYLADRLVEAWEAEGRPAAVLAVRHRAQARLAADAEVEQVALDARRLAAEHCLYGVDVNPLAVEMAKLSLWLVTMDRERPFGFLDDRLVAGDSLLGLASVEQLTTLHAHPDGGPAELPYADGWTDALAHAADLRRRITAHPVVTGRDAAVKASLLRQAREQTAQLTAVADAVTGVGLAAAGMKAKKAVDAKFTALSITVGNSAPDYATALTDQIRSVQDGRPAGVVPRAPLHWPLVFPEVFADADDPGFDAIIGNPPFSGGQKLSDGLGADYLNWLQRWDGRDVKGSTDLAARFVLRAERLLAGRGQLGYIAVNTLVQGKTLTVGLAQVVGRGSEIRRGRSSHPWPTDSANLEIVDVWASRAPVAAAGLRWLDGEEVPEIGADLEPVGQVRGRPQQLPENDDLAFQGSNILGLGFTMTEEQARALIDKDARNAEVLAPYVIGKDLNQRPDCSASRWVINFRDWSRERAEQYPDAYDIVERLVKPKRSKNKDRSRRELWWRFTRPAPELYRSIEKLDHVLALSLLSSAVLPVRVPIGPVFAHKCAVFALDTFADLAVLSSNIHSTWVVRYTSTTRRDINYSPSDVFRTLPRPDPTPDLERLGARLDAERRALMLGRGWGLTTTYNHVHDPADRDPAVAALRELHAEIDHAVLAAHGWDLDPEIGHHRTKIGTRWTVSPAARFALLDLLLAENHRRAGYTP